MLRFSNTKSSMFYNLLSAGVALWVILDELLVKTTVQGWSVAEDGVQFYTLVAYNNHMHTVSDWTIPICIW
jgi:hypothetical protein